MSRARQQQKKISIDFVLRSNRLETIELCGAFTFYLHFTFLFSLVMQRHQNHMVFGFGFVDCFVNKFQKNEFQTFECVWSEVKLSEHDKKLSLSFHELGHVR